MEYQHVFFVFNCVRHAFFSLSLPLQQLYVLSCRYVKIVRATIDESNWEVPIQVDCKKCRNGEWEKAISVVEKFCACVQMAIGFSACKQPMRMKNATPNYDHETNHSGLDNDYVFVSTN